MFRIGQKVVAIRMVHDREGNICAIKDKVYTVLDIRYCPKCGNQSIDIGERIVVSTVVCYVDNGVLESNTDIWYMASNNFAPVISEEEGNADIRELLDVLNERVEVKVNKINQYGK